MAIFYQSKFIQTNLNSFKFWMRAGRIRSRRCWLYLEKFLAQKSLNPFNLFPICSSQGGFTPGDGPFGTEAVWTKESGALQVLTY